MTRLRANNMKTTRGEIADYRGREINECYVCGHLGKVERAHIVPDMLGGSDDPDNLVLLCEWCHIESPDCTDPRVFWSWVESRPAPVTRWVLEFQRLMAETPVDPALVDWGAVPNLMDEVGDMLGTHQGFSITTSAWHAYEAVRRATCRVDEDPRYNKARPMVEQTEPLMGLGD